MMARGVETVIWGTIGALLGLAATAVAGYFITNFAYLIWQPTGAAVGALIAAALVSRRWRGIFDSHQDVSR